MDNLEDHINSIRTEWTVMKEKWFHGETMDPVFEGVVRDFCTFDEIMHGVYNKVQVFMRGVESLAQGMTALSEGVAGGLSHTNDSLIASDSCKLKEATNQIARADAPHSAIAKLRRDMHFNILNPVQNHIVNNRNLKVSLDIRRRRLIELNSAKKHFEDVVKKNIGSTDRRYLQAQSGFEAAKATFNDVDRHVFEWLYILEEYRGDILDSTLQTLKYLEYEFFASSAHAISTSLPSRMEFRPMVEMTPEHLEAQVEMELQKNEESEVIGAGGDMQIVDFSARLIDKKVKEDPADGDGPALPVDPLSLSSLLSQGFEEGPARRALRKHQNDTQAALDWLINGQAEEDEKRKLVSDGVRMPTTVKRVQKLKAMRRAQQEKQREKEKAEGGGSDSDRDKDKDSDKDGGGGRGSGDRASNGTSRRDEARSKPPPPKESSPRPPVDLLESMDGEQSKTPAKSSAAVGDLLSLDERPAEPTDFSKPVDLTSLPAQLSFDTTKCEKQPLSAAVAAGLAKPRMGVGSGDATGMQGLDLGQVAPAAAPDAAVALSAALPGLSPELLAHVQAIAATSQVSREQLIAALSGGGAAAAGAQAAPSQPPAMASAGAAGLGAAGAAPRPVSSGWDQLTGGSSPLVTTTAAGGSGGMGAFQGLDPFAEASRSDPFAGSSGASALGGPAAVAAPAQASSGAAKDSFGDLVNFGPGGAAAHGGYPSSG